MRTEGFRGVLLSILVIALIASTMSLLSLSLAFAEPGQSPPLGGGNLVIVQSVDANTLDVHRTRFDWAYQVIALVHDTLMTFDYEMKYIPMLAESWEIDPDGFFIDYHLRTDVKFHCGEPFNADAVVYTIRRCKEPWSAHADSVKNVLDAEKLDEYTVRIHLKQWDRWLYDWFATTSSSIVCPRCAEEYGLDYGEKYFCGTGPFKVKEWIRDDRLILERNEDYRWGPVIYQNRGPAHLAGITFEVIPVDISREDKFKKGEADMMIGFSPRPALVEWLNTTENVIFIINASSSMSYVGFHVGTQSPEILQGIVSGRPYPPGAIRSPVSDDPEGKGLLVRKALLYATHRENLVEFAWDGMGKVAYGPLTSVIWGYNPAMEDMYPYDPEMARSLLAQAGYAEGLELTVIMTNYEPYTKTAQVLKEQWAKVGVTLNIEIRAFGDIEGIIANAQHDLWIGGWTWHNADMIRWYWHTTRVPPASNRFWWGNAYSDAVIENTNSIDDDVAYRAIQESQRLIMEDAAYLPVVERPFLLAHWDRVKGFKMHPLSNLVWKHLDTCIGPSHGPILIVGNDDFTPANGVVRGSGTENDPYIIENWDISAENANGIEIRNTTAHFIIRNCYVHDGRKEFMTGYVGIALYNVTNGKIDNNLLKNNLAGILLDNSDSSLVSNNLVENSWGGVVLLDSSNNRISNNIARNNRSDGIFLGGDNNLVSNNVVGNQIDGIHIIGEGNLVSNNVAENNYDGILLFGSGNNLSSNIMKNNINGIELMIGNNNLISNNLVENNDYGIYLHSPVHSDNNRIYHNNFINNTSQAHDPHSNFWDNGYPSGGNYWSDYTGADSYSGENQDMPGSDGIGDTPYYIPGDSNRDRYPLMNPWSPIIRDVEVSISPPYQSGLPGRTLVYTVTLKNVGSIADDYTLAVADTKNWGLALSENRFENIPPGENRLTTLGVIIPENAVPSTEDNITVTATSQADNTVSDNDSFIARVQMVWIGWIRQFGSSAADFAIDVAVDSSGNVYVAGLTFGGALPGQTSAGGYDAFVRKYDSAGNELWTRQFGTSTTDKAWSVAADTLGNVYVAGYTYGTLPGQTSAGGSDAFVRKYGGAGNELWTRQFGTSAGDYAYGVAVDTLGNVNVAGKTKGALPGQTPSGDWDAFVRKYDSAGNELWTRQFGTSSADVVRDVAIDISGNVYVAGETYDALPGETSAGITDAFVRKYDGTGNELWTRQFGTSGFDGARGVAVDKWGNAYVAGHIGSAPPGLVYDAFVRKYDGTGNELWTKQFGSSDDDFANGVAVDISGNVYVAGETYGALPGETSAGGIDAFVRKYDSAGNELWTRQFGTSAGDAAHGDVARSVAASTWGNVYVAGDTWGALPGQTSSGRCDAFVVKFVQPSPPPPPGIEWNASITATFSGGSDDAIFGVRPGATSSFDYAYDIPEPPALPEPPYARAYFYYHEQTPDKLHRSCLLPENLMEWPLRIEYADNIENVILTWSVKNVPTEYSVFLYQEENLVANMRAEDNYTFEASTGSYDFRIVVGTIVPFTLELTQGWNMISFPVLPENLSPDSIFGSYYVLCRWDAENKRYVVHADSGSFIEPDPDVEAGVGYWAYVLENENVNLLGVPVNQLTLNLRQGWNLIGPPYGGSSIADLADDSDNSVIPWAFTWNAREKSYSMTQLLEAGKGYWVYALQPPQPSYPAITAISAKSGDNEIRINVTTGSIPANEWAYSVSSTEGSYSWTTGTSELDPPYVSLGTYASGTYYVSLKHIDSGHFYFNDQTITI